MGLSTAQARLLTITARKSDCEFQSMSLSHQKIALSRDMEKISNEYQNSLNNTKLVYDYYGTGTSSMDLSYGLLMSPSVYNDYYPKLVTDAKNRVVLNSAIAAAARAAGIPAEGLTGTSSSSVRNKFIQALAGEDVITPAKATTIQSTPYSNVIGVGSTIAITSSTTDITYDELLDLIDAKCDDSATFGVTLGIGTSGNDGWERFSIQTENDFKEINDPNGTVSQTIRLRDLLSGDTNYNLAVHTRQGEKIPLSAAYYLQEKIVGQGENDTGSILNWITEQFAKVLGGTTQNDLALQRAYDAVFDLIYPNDHIANDVAAHPELYTDKKGDLKEWCNSRQGSSIKEHLDEIGTGTKINKTGSYQEYVTKSSKDYLGFCYTYDYDHAGTHADRHDRSQISINLNNIAQVFLTAFVEAQTQDSNYSYNVGEKKNSNLYKPERDNFMFTMVSDTTVDTGDTCLEANFYDTLFNKICTNGWTENAMVEDKQYLQELMKSGMVFISSIGNDGHYYQGNYSTDKYISEVADDEAIAKAEAKYNTEKSKIESKEETIDLKMKNLDTEISSLTTEYDTTKSIITKSIEKSFKRYDA
ncbi:hypothetical protein HDR58_04065 [bacterium]|nr:hypothetical protein [bacterium]